MVRENQPSKAEKPSGTRPAVVIGWKEYVDFPAWGIRRVRAKVDTGARTSALDVARYELHECQGQGLVADLHLTLRPRHRKKPVVVRVPVLRMVTVSNSAGMRETRPLIETELCLGSVRKKILLTITNRHAMRFRMILGRQALANDFVVDVGKKYLCK